MTNKQALREEFRNMQDHYSDPADRKRQEIYIAAEALLDELEAAEKLLSEITAPNMLLPVIDNLDENQLRDVIKTCTENYSLLHSKWEAAEKRVAELESREVKLPSFDGYVPHIAKELQAAFRIACADAGIRINGES